MTVAGAVRAALSDCCYPLRMAVAFSGGRDSIALLHAAAAYAASGDRTGLELHAFHVHHGISPRADAWLDFCARRAAALGVVFDAAHVDLGADRANLEARAREARYRALNALCERHRIDLLLTAHHRDDQAETVLLRLLRGSGPAGLAGMPAARPLRGGSPVTLLRPLLGLPRSAIQAYIDTHGLDWIEDESNADARYTRNAVRHQLMPECERIRPGAAARIAETAGRIAETCRLLDDLARIDFAAVADAHGTPTLEALSELPARRVKNLLRDWFVRAGARAPGDALLEQIVAQLGQAGADAMPAFTHAGWTLRLWQRRLWLDPALSALPGGHGEATMRWAGETVWPLPEWGGALCFERCAPGEIGVAEAVLAGGRLDAGPRRGGERLRPFPGRPSRTLKNLFQEAGVPPWRRDVPLIRLDGELLFVPGLGLDAGRLSCELEPRWRLRWETTLTPAQTSAEMPAKTPAQTPDADAPPGCPGHADET